MGEIGSIVFGPKLDQTDRQYWRNLLGGYSVGAKADTSSLACNCIGPQLGETKCPCALRNESESGRRMIQDGVTINGKHYKLIAT